MVCFFSSSGPFSLTRPLDEILTTRGPQYPRIIPHSKGRMGRSYYKTSHITVYVKPKNTKITREDLEERKAALKELKEQKGKEVVSETPVEKIVKEEPREDTQQGTNQKKSWWSWGQ